MTTKHRGRTLLERVGGTGRVTASVLSIEGQYMYEKNPGKARTRVRNVLGDVVFEGLGYECQNYLDQHVGKHVIQDMRKPTQAMLDAGTEAYLAIILGGAAPSSPGGVVQAVYLAMIDTALTEKPERPRE